MGRFGIKPLNAVVPLWLVADPSGWRLVVVVAAMTFGITCIIWLYDELRAPLSF
jgi:hypothetical protein